MSGAKFDPLLGALRTADTYNPTTDTIHLLKAGDTMTGATNYTSAVVNPLKYNGTNLMYVDSSNNVALGLSSIPSTTSGSYNVAMGTQALTANTSGSYNLAFGYQALTSNQSGQSNVALGFGSLINNVAGQGNMAIGTSSLAANNGYFNVGVGVQSGQNTTSDKNTFIGYQTGVTNTSGGSNVFIGFSSGYYSNAGNLLIVGNVLQSNATNEAKYSLLYGTFAGSAGTTSGQSLTVNGNVTANNGFLNVQGGTGDSNLGVYAGGASAAAFVSMYTNNTNYMGLSGWDNVGGNLMWRIGNSGFSGLSLYTNTGGSGGGATTRALSIDYSQNTTLYGNLTLSTAGNKLNIAVGTNASAGTALLAAGTITVSTTAVTANSLIMVTTQSAGTLANLGEHYISAKTAGTSFVISSSNILDNSTVAWVIIN